MKPNFPINLIKSHKLDLDDLTLLEKSKINFLKKKISHIEECCQQIQVNSDQYASNTRKNLYLLDSFSGRSTRTASFSSSDTLAQYSSIEYGELAANESRTEAKTKYLWIQEPSDGSIQSSKFIKTRQEDYSFSTYFSPSMSVKAPNQEKKCILELKSKNEKSKKGRKFSDSWPKFTIQSDQNIINIELSENPAQNQHESFSSFHDLFNDIPTESKNHEDLLETLYKSLDPEISNRKQADDIKNHKKDLNKDLAWKSSQTNFEPIFPQFYQVHQDLNILRIIMHDNHQWNQFFS